MKIAMFKLSRRQDKNVVAAISDRKKSFTSIEPTILIWGLA